MSGVVIKAGEAATLSRGMYSLDLRDISRQAAATLAAARSEAERIAADARREAAVSGEAARAEARRQGREEGLAEGRKQGHAEALAEARERFVKEQGEMAAVLASMVSELRDRRERLYLAARRDVIVLAVAIASRIVKRLAASEDIASQAALDACREALELLGTPTEVLIRAHPDDRAMIERLSADLTASLNASRDVRIVESDAVDRGGVVVQTADSEVNATIRDRLERIVDELVTGWRSRVKELSLES